jgi:probable HAF family extracellular repeat protein
MFSWNTMRNVLRPQAPRRQGGRRPTLPLHLEVLEDRCLLSGYTITDLGTLGGPSSTALSLSNSGAVVGQADTTLTYTVKVYDQPLDGSKPHFHMESRYFRHAFLWAPGTNGGITDLGTLNDAKNFSDAMGINASGQVVGASSGHPVLWQSGGITELGTFVKGNYGSANGINDATASHPVQVIGDVIQSTGYPLAAVWDLPSASNGKISVTNLGTLPGGRFSDAKGINSIGQVVGDSATGALDAAGRDIYHAVLWQNGHMTDLGALGGDDSTATGINSSGEVIGYATTAPPDPNAPPELAYTYHAFLWQNGTVTDLGTLPGVSNSHAYGINATGQVVGESGHAVLWQNGTITDLNGLLSAGSGWVLYQANAINDAGQIVGYGVNPQGLTHAFLLTPSVQTAQPTTATQGTATPSPLAPVSTASAAGEVSAPAQPGVSLLTSFAGFAAAESNLPFPAPPDTSVAAGPNHVVEVVNSSLAFFDKTTGARLFQQSLQDFFAPVGGGQFVGEVGVTYDELVGRFVVSTNDGQAPSSFLDVALSNDSNPLDGFTKLHIDMTESSPSGPLRADFPRVAGWNADAYVFAVNMVSRVDAAFDHVQLLVLDKSLMTVRHIDLDGKQFANLTPAIMHGSLLGDPLWLVETGQVDHTGFSHGGNTLRVVKMTDVLSATPTFQSFDIPVSPFASPPSATQPGNGTIDSGDTSLLNAAWRDGRLVTAQTVGSNGDARVRWYEFNTSGASPTLTQSGEINQGKAVNTYYPSIEIAANGDLGMTFTESSGSEFMAMYVTGRTLTDPAGEMRAPVLVRAGVANYSFGGPNGSSAPAGDYSGISVDPSNGTAFWVSNQYATAASAINWGTTIGNFSIGDPGSLANRVQGYSTVQGEGSAGALLAGAALGGGNPATPPGKLLAPLALPGPSSPTPSAPNAAGWGWFVDPTPADDSEFTTPGDQGEQNRIGLLSVLGHELGHLLGYPHADSGLMGDTLAAGVRLTPAEVDPLFAAP